MKTTLLCILDGFGLNPNPVGNAVKLAKTPCISELMAHNPFSTLTTFGPRVGLPDGQMGNSEVGHLNIGAGRVVEQWLVQITRELKEDYLPKIPAYVQFIKASSHAKQLHIIGLYSDGGVHSQDEHLHLLLRRVTRDYKGRVVLHVITDGRDVSPESGAGFVEKLAAEISHYPSVTIGTICGRFFAMDRDKRWERTQKAFDLYVSGVGVSSTDPAASIRVSYAENITDEFIEPICVDHHGIDAGDAVLFWNYRADRMRQIVRALCVESFDGFPRKSPPFTPDRTLGFTDYDRTYSLPYLFEPKPITNHLGEVIAKTGMRQLRVAETEKYPHVTYFLNGGIEVEYAGEERKMVPSPRDVKTYDLKPEMSAAGVTDIVVQGLESGDYALIVVNLANCDMVGHTGVLEAAIKAVETVDGCLARMLAALSNNGGSAVILADHGNAEQMINYEDGTPHTAHTTWPVPVIVTGGPAGITLRADGALCDVAPTVLKLMGLSQPPEMTGRSLF